MVGPGSLRTLWDDLWSSLWFQPGVMTVGAVAAAWSLLRADRWVVATELELGPWGYGGGADSARQVLATIAGSIMTVTGVTFSITMVALVLAAGQYTPRVLRNFVRDRVNQTVLGVFVGTFLFTLLVLRAIRAGDDAFVPALAVTASIALAVVSLGFFLYFLHHMANAIQVSNIIRNVARETHAEIDRTFEQAAGFSGPPLLRGGWQPPAAGLRVVAEKEGYVIRIATDALIAAARAHETTLDVVVGPGDFVSRGEAVAFARGNPAERARLADQVREAIHFDSQRSISQDPAYGFRQLVDIAVRALSPGVNDPTTACNCVDYLGGFLAHLADLEWPDVELRDDDGAVRVIAPRGTFTGYVDLACSEIRHYGRADLATTVRLLEALRRAADATTRSDRRAALRRAAEAILEGAERSILSTIDRDRVGESAQRLAEAIGDDPAGYRLAPRPLAPGLAEDGATLRT
jgi:uncharacterized membrane protein